MDKLSKASVIYNALSSGMIIFDMGNDDNIIKMFPSGELGKLPVDDDIETAIEEGKFSELMEKDLLVFERSNLTLKEFADLCSEADDKFVIKLMRIIIDKNKAKEK